MEIRIRILDKHTVEMYISINWTVDLLSFNQNLNPEEEWTKPTIP